MKQHCLKGIFYLFHSRTKLISPVIYLQFSRWVTWLIIALVEIKKEKEWVQEKAKQNCGRWSAGGRWQRGWWRGNDHHLRREIEKLKVKNRNLKKEVEEINAERVLLRTERNERADKYSKLKKKKMQQQQNDHADQMDQQQFMIRMMQANWRQYRWSHCTENMKVWITTYCIIKHLL